MDSSKETGCRASEGPILCINNCGFFGSAATMYMCSKCHKDTVLKQQQPKLANIVKGHSSTDGKKPIDLGVSTPQPSSALGDDQEETKVKEGPNRCTTCRKRVGLTGFSCRCGNTFCTVHRYSDKHDCPFDYRGAAQDAISQSNPIVKARKLDKI